MFTTWVHSFGSGVPPVNVRVRAPIWGLSTQVLAGPVPSCPHDLGRHLHPEHQGSLQGGRKGKGQTAGPWTQRSVFPR